MKQPFNRGHRVICAAALGLAISAAAVGAAFAAEGASMTTREGYAAYLARFNAGDDSYADFYAPEVVFDHGPYGILNGRQAIVDFYHGIRKELKEEVTASQVIISYEKDAVAAEIATKLTALKDGVKLPSRDIPMKKGETLISRGLVIYKLKDGKVVDIRPPARGVTFIPAGQ